MRNLKLFISCLLVLALAAGPGGAVYVRQPQGIGQEQRIARTFEAGRDYGGTPAKKKLLSVFDSLAFSQFGDTRSVSKVKALTDFDGNAYELIELAPTGYLIYHPEAGRVVEAAEDAPSPYLNNSEGLYYGGPTYYYIKEGDNFRHPVLDEKLVKEDFDADISADAYSALSEKKDPEVLNFFADEKAESFHRKRKPVSAVKNAVKRTSVKYPEFFSQMESTSYYEMYDDGYKNICGYIASAMLLTYYDTYYKSGLIAYNHMPAVNSAGQYSINKNLTEYLIETGFSLGYGRHTVASNIYNVLINYAQDTGNTIEVNWVTAPFFNDKIYNTIANGAPVLLFGKLINPSDKSKKTDHVVTCYEGKWEDQFWFIHHVWIYANFGWGPDFNRICVDGTFGELLAINKV